MAEKATLWQFSMLIPLKTLSDSENPWFSRLQIRLLLKWFFCVPASSVTCGDDLLIRRSLHMQPYLLSNPTVDAHVLSLLRTLHAANGQPVPRSPTRSAEVLMRPSASHSIPQHVLEKIRRHAQ